MSKSPFLYFYLEPHHPPERLARESLMPRGKNVRATDDVAVMKRRVAVAENYLRGMTIAKLADHLKVSPNTISNDLKACREEWLSRMMAAFSAKKAEELAKLDELESQAWHGWQKSCTNREVIVTRTQAAVRQKKRSRKGGVKFDPFSQTTEKSVYGQSGDPRFLEMIHKIIETRLKVMGVFKEGSSQTIVQINWSDMIRDPNSGSEPTRRLEDPIEKQIIEAENMAGIKTSPDDEPSTIQRLLPSPYDPDEEDE